MYHSLIQILSAVRLIGSVGGASITELTEKLGISRRSVYRLLSALEELGYPLYKDEEHGNRFHLVERTKAPSWWTPIPQVDFNMDDRVLIDYLFSQASKIPGIAEASKELRNKLSLIGASAGYSLAPKDSGAGGSHNPVLLKVTSPYKITNPASEGHTKLLMEAVENCRVCLITYESRESRKGKTYRIHPLALFEGEGGLYCFVKVERFGTIRILAIERIQKLVIQKDYFIPPTDFNAEQRLSDPFGFIQENTISVKLRISPSQASYVRDRVWPESYILEDLADGGLRMSFETKALFGLKRWILSWGASIHVEAPSWLADLIREEAVMIIDNSNRIQTTL